MVVRMCTRVPFGTWYDGHWYGTRVPLLQYGIPWYSSTMYTDRGMVPCGTRTLLQEEVNIISLNSRSTVVSLHMLPAKHLVDALSTLFGAPVFRSCGSGGSICER